jgi:hypothetical protein
MSAPTTILNWPKRFYQPLERVPYAVGIFLFVDAPAGQNLHQALTTGDPWRVPVWGVGIFYLLLAIYATSGRLWDIGLPRWYAVPYSILTFAPYLLLFYNHTMSFWIAVFAVIVLQLPVMILKGKPAAQ